MCVKEICKQDNKDISSDAKTRTFLSQSDIDVCPDGGSCFCTAETKAISKKQYVQNQDQNPEQRVTHTSHTQSDLHAEETHRSMHSNTHTNTEHAQRFHVSTAIQNLLHKTNTLTETLLILGRTLVPQPGSELECISSVCDLSSRHITPSFHHRLSTL